MLTHIVLTKAVNKIGGKGDILSVKPGFARNFLIPNGLAHTVTDKEIKALKEERVRKEDKLQKTLNQGEDLKKQLSNKRILLALPANSSGTLYGSATARDMQGAIYATYGVDIPENAILFSPIKSVGLHIFNIATRNHGEVTMKVKIIAAPQQ